MMDSTSVMLVGSQTTLSGQCCKYRKNRPMDDGIAKIPRSSEEDRTFVKYLFPLFSHF